MPSADKRHTECAYYFQEQDAKRRLGTFTAAGEHARVGSRTAGIIGQTKRAFQTDHKRTKSKAHFGKPDKSRGGV